ncbi:hypothetical protein GLOIN_2v1480248 [Rhizophagus irregularis DAOM 181602=DAOM 197198]|uniref:Uncharacterized protein n=1 Tax=Rhizophagus irregularis (strain DAOM 181602 / DAOM 197198 / MUCL 43194) TaxID=747089 RepID=A0A2P4PUR1_RHIID|nr:hypothetical protein GLOIN_2v1480248 [Rhizophagus irregularis DAOM 181602=DAOM 197198]POG69121.1 hypothetical protein GLOIN_2v1480248 [Rhizophagus irregularis DAOM 181602=DAOM 197198]|eukprot:XP_025175987.1 hypothetical protein GLOIN_2v1480248 [Rhizophagus irregularis DAOM 181602=DAOM 197198]
MSLTTSMGLWPRAQQILKTLALNILGHLPEDILHEEPDFSSIKSNETITGYGPCGERDLPFLTEDPPRSLILNVCGDIAHRTCAKETDKRYYSCGVDDDSCLLKILMMMGWCNGANVTCIPSFLPCKHRAHFDCIDKKHMLCPKCPSIDDLEKEGYYISPTSNEASKKRKRQGGSRKSTTQTIIRELSIRPPSGISIDAPSEDSDMREVSNQFHKFYYDIDNAE